MMRRGTCDRKEDLVGERTSALKVISTEEHDDIAQAAAISTGPGPMMMIEHTNVALEHSRVQLEGIGQGEPLGQSSLWQFPVQGGPVDSSLR